MPALPAQLVRTLTGLTADELDDTHIENLLEVHGDVVKLAAADALEVVAGQLVSASDPEGLSIDGSKRATVLMARARGLREQVTADAAAADDAFAFDVVPAASGGRPELTERQVCW